MCLPGASIHANSLAHANTLAEFVKREIGIFFEIRKGWLQGRAGLTSQRMPSNPGNSGDYGNRPLRGPTPPERVYPSSLCARDGRCVRPAGCANLSEIQFANCGNGSS